MKLFRIAALLCTFTLLVFAEDSTSEKTPPADLLASGHVDQAITNLKARTSATPEDAEAWHLLSRSYYALSRWDDSIAAGKQAISLKPSNSDYHLWLGRAIGEKADSVGSFHWWTALSLAKQARAEFEKAVELDANNVGARSDLAEFYAEAPGIVGGGKDKARRQADQLQARNAAAAHWIKGLIAEKDKDFKTAEQEFKAAVTSSGNDGGRWLDLASFYRKMDRRADMEHAINEAIASPNKRSVVFYDAASILYGTNGDLSNAAALVRRYLSSPVKSEEAPAFQAHYLLGSILEKLGQKDSAVEEYRAALALYADYSDALNALQRLGQH